MDKALQEQGGNQVTEGSNLVTPAPYRNRAAGAKGLAEGRKSGQALLLLAGNGLTGASAGPGIGASAMTAHG